MYIAHLGFKSDRTRVAISSSSHGIYVSGIPISTHNPSTFVSIEIVDAMQLLVGPGFTTHLSAEQHRQVVEVLLLRYFSYYNRIFATVDAILGHLKPWTTTELANLTRACYHGATLTRKQHLAYELICSYNYPGVDKYVIWEYCNAVIKALPQAPYARIVTGAYEF